MEVVCFPERGLLQRFVGMLKSPSLDDWHPLLKLPLYPVSNGLTLHPNEPQTPNKRLLLLPPPALHSVLWVNSKNPVNMAIFSPRIYFVWQFFLLHSQKSALILLMLHLCISYYAPRSHLHVRNDRTWQCLLSLGNRIQTIYTDTNAFHWVR